MSEYLNHRVVIFNSIPTANGAAADIVLGQGDFIHKTPMDDNQDGNPDATCSARTLRNPLGVAIGGGKIFVTDNGNNRILIFE